MTETRRLVASAHARSAVVLLIAVIVSAVPLRAQEQGGELLYPVLLDPSASTLASTVTAGGLEEASVVEVLNPTFYYALYAVLGRYLVTGEGDGPVPAVRVLGVRLLPSIHLRLAPFGREYAAAVIAARDGSVLRAGIRPGDGPWGHFRGLEVEGRNLYTGERLQLGGRAGLWRQFDIDGGSDEKSLGGVAVVRATASLRALPLSPVVELGAKTRGFAPGEALSAGPIARLGAAVRF